jgi:hypothetical protein
VRPGSLQLAKGVAAPRIAGVIPLTAQAVRNVARRYQQGGLDRALYEKKRPGAVAGKRCGWWPTSLTTISPRWKTCWRARNGGSTRSNR